MAKMQPRGPSDSEPEAQASSNTSRSGGRWVKGRTGRRLWTAILLALLIFGVPIATLVGGWGVAIWLVLGAFALLFIGPVTKAPDSGTRDSPG